MPRPDGGGGGGERGTAAAPRRCGPLRDSRGGQGKRRRGEHRRSLGPQGERRATRGGLSVSIVDGDRYYGSHFATIADSIRAGARVEAGQRLGTVGNTGSAPTPCHLHFALTPPCGLVDWEVRRGVVYPWPFLDARKADEHRPPVAAVQFWWHANPALCPPP